MRARGLVGEVSVAGAARGLFPGSFVLFLSSVDFPNVGALGAYDVFDTQSACLKINQTSHFS